MELFIRFKKVYKSINYQILGRFSPPMPGVPGGHPS